MPHSANENLFSEPATRVVWAGICALEEADQHDILRELRRRLGNPKDRAGDLSRKEARGIAALRTATDLLGGESPSQRRYERLRKEHPDLDLPAEGTVRSWLGGTWNAALRRAHLDAVPEPEAAVAPAKPRFSNEELVAAVKECAVDLERTPSAHDYLAWARRPDVRLREGRRAASLGPFTRAFRGWLGVLVAAGLADDFGTGAPVTGGKGRGYRYTDEELFNALAEIVNRLDGAFPTTTQLAHERERFLAERDEAGLPPRALPGYLTFQRRFGSWAATRRAFEQRQKERNDGA